MPFRVHNKDLGSVYTVGVVSDGETDITSPETPAVNAGSHYVNAVYGEDASTELSTSTAKKSTSKSTKES